MAEELKGFANLMRYCNTLEDYEQKKADGIVTDDVLVIVLQEKVAKFKGQTFDWNGGGGGGSTIDPELLEAYMPITRDFSDDFNNDFAR